MKDQTEGNTGPTKRSLISHHKKMSKDLGFHMTGTLI